MLQKTVILLVSAIIVFILSACGETTGDGLPTVSSPNFGTVPEINFPSNKPPQSILIKVLDEDDGKGQTVGDSDFASVDYYGKAWGGTQLPDSAIAGSSKPRSFSLTDPLIGGWMALRGARVGRRFMLTMPPTDAYGDLGSESTGVKKGDTLTYVADIRLAISPDAGSQFQVTPTNEALPQGVSVNASESDDFGVNASAAGEYPTKQSTAVYVQGNGENVKSGQSVAVKQANTDWGKTTAPGDQDNAKMCATGAGSIKTKGLPLGSMILVMYPATPSSEPRAALLQILTSYDIER